MAYEPLVKGRKVHGTSFPREFLTGRMDFFTVRTTVDLTLDDPQPTDEFWEGQGADPADVSQQRFDRLVETVSLRAQPVILGEVLVETETAPVSDLPSTQSLSTGASVTVYTVRFGIEHQGAWEDAESLAAALDGVKPRDTNTGAELDGFVWDGVDPSNNNVAVYLNEFLSKSRT